MIFDTTYRNEDYEEISDEKLGKAFSFFQRVAMGGIGSARLPISEVSESLRLKARTTNDIEFGSIELRPKGLIVHLGFGLIRTSWVIPYYQLSLYNSEYVSIHAGGHRVRFTKNRNYRLNMKFMAKVLRLKQEYLQAQGFVE